MERKILLTGVILAICISVIIGVIFIYSGTKTGSNPISIIPQDAAYVIRLNGLDIAKTVKNKNNLIWKDLIGLQFINNIDKEISVLDSLITSDENINEYIRQNDIYVSGHSSGGKNINHLTLLKIPANFSDNEIEKLIEKANEHRISNYSQRKYEGKTIYSITLKTERIIYLTSCNSVLAYSSSPVLIEDAIRQSTLSESLLNNPDFAEVTSTTGKNKDANIFVDFSQIGKLASLTSNNKYASNFRSFKKFAGWSELDVNIKSNLILLNGFAEGNTDTPGYLSSITTQEAVRITIDKILPATTNSFLIYGLSSPKENYQAFLDYLKECDKYASYNANLNNLNTKYGVDFTELFLSLIDDEIALVSKPNTSTQTLSQYIVLKSKSGSEADKQLLALTETIANTNNAAKTLNYSPDNSLRFNIYKIPIYPLFERLLGDMFDVFEECYLTVVDNYVIVAGSYEDASSFIHSYILQKTLENDEVYRSFAEDISMKSYMLAYTNLSSPNNLFSKYIDNDLLDSWRQNTSKLNNIQSLGLQISDVSNLPYLSIFLKRYGNYRGRPKTVWESLLDTTLTTKPSFIVNHYTKQNEIFIQDDKNNVYLLNHSGRILWSFQLTEKINSEVFQIDYFKNGKLQILFSTNNYLHLIDRNGNYVENYPIKLRAEATAGLALFDYAKNRDYRIFIPCDDKKVYAYAKDGAIISGWQFKGADHNVLQPVQYFNIEGKDFIVFGDKQKTYILDRKGNDRVIPKSLITKSQNNKYHLHNTGKVANSYILTTNTEGNLVKIYFDGNTEIITIKNLSPTHYFDYKDINGNGKSDYIFLDNQNLRVTDNEMNTIFNIELDHEITHRPVYYHFSHSNRKLGLVAQNDEKIYLINNNGEIYKNFPLEGKTLFSIGYFDLTSSRFNLIVGGRNNFLYNYAVE